MTLSVEQAAQLLGVGRNQIYNMIHEGAFPHVRFGRKIRIPVASLEAWLTSQSARVSGI